MQIGTYLKSMKNDKIFEGIQVQEQKINGTYKYFSPPMRSKTVADKEKLRLRAKGFEGAFVVAFFQGKRISTKEALDLQKKK